MKIPEIPTDNLYKLMAISGLTILLLCCLIPYYRHYNLHLKALQLGGEVAELKIDVSRNEEETKILSSDTDELKKQLKLVDPNEKIDHLEEAKEIKKMFLQQMELTHQQKKRSALIKAKSNQHLFISDSILKERTWFITGRVCGVFLTFVGFFLWYIKLQRPQDIILSRKIKNEQKQ